MAVSNRTLRITVDGEPVTVPDGANLAPVLLERGAVFRRSVTDLPRQPLCAMGTCFECRVTVDGMPNVRACRIVCRADMVVETETGRTADQR
ncbi:MAG: (2Fe-2S)-binding protein [Thermoanaerobaculia bacterium]|nr:(2Fe-2S)-binding protein [Thermoanaerobaculia bacterium]